MTQMATVSMNEEEAAESTLGVAGILSILGFLGAAAVLFLQVTTASTTWLQSPDQKDAKKPAEVEWSKLF